MRDPMHFEALANEYAAARPPYPSALWDAIRERGILQVGHRALDLGAGTGQATGPLLAAGLHVTSVEPGERLAQQLSSAFPAATVTVARAEDTQLAEKSFDLVVAATSIHWLDLDVLLPKLRRALTDVGVLLVWRNVFGDPEAPVTQFRREVQQIVRDRGAPCTSGADPENAEATGAQLTATGLFVLEEILTFRWSIELDYEGIRRLFATFSDWTSVEVDRAASAARESGGTVIEHYTSWLIVLKPANDAG